MFKLLRKFHIHVARLLLNVNVGLLSLIGFWGAVALLLAAAGIVGLAASKESLRSVYEERMLANRMLLQASLSEVSLGARASVNRVSTVFPSLLSV